MIQNFNHFNILWRCVNDRLEACFFLSRRSLIMTAVPLPSWYNSLEYMIEERERERRKKSSNEKSPETKPNTWKGSLNRCHTVIFSWNWINTNLNDKIYQNVSNKRLAQGDTKTYEEALVSLYSEYMISLNCTTKNIHLYLVCFRIIESSNPWHK